MSVPLRRLGGGEGGFERKGKKCHAQDLAQPLRDGRGGGKKGHPALSNVSR